MKYYGVSFAILVAVLAPGIDGQMMATSGPIPLESIGLPPEPPFLTLLGMGNPGKLATDPSILPKGRALSEVLYEELRGRATAAGPADGVEASLRTKFDERGRITEQIQNRWNSESDTLYGYRDDHLVSMETTMPAAKKPGAKAWNYWTYNSEGKLQEYRRGSGTAIENHELGFHYDKMGRLLDFEYRQGPDDKPFSRTEISYSTDSKTITVTRGYTGTKIVDRSTRTIDDQRRVVRVTLDSEGRPTKDQAKNISFRYDVQGRLAEQITDATKFSDADSEHDLPPGTISIAYDDKAHTKTTKYSFPNEGTMEFVVTQNEDGATLGYSLKRASEEVSSKLECEYDSFGNWTSCRQIVESQGRTFIKEKFRRTITYR